jgi:hypothetical protein
VLRIVGFFVVALVVWGGGHWYLARRLLAPSELRGWARRLAWVYLAASFVLPILAMSTARLGSTLPGYDALQWAGWIVMGLSSVLFMFTVAADFGRAIARAGRRFIAAPEPGDVLDPSRRRFFGRIANAGVVGSAALTGGVATAKAQFTAEVVEVDVEIPGLPPELEGFRIVQLTDIHIGPTLRGDDLRAMVERANALHADIMAVTGDLIDGFVEDLREHVAPLGELRGRHGTYFVTGNHEYYWGVRPWCEEVARLGLTVLNNEHRVIEVGTARLLLAGVTDHQGGDHDPEHESDPAAACAGAPDHDVSVLLAHQPRSIYAAAEAGYDLQISGHTHGGQYFPMNLLVHLVQPYVAGLHLHGGTQIYVSRGTGYWGPPMRLGAPQEITLLSLHGGPRLPLRR